MATDLNPILVTGSHRSGTTWTGKMLAAAADTAYISEPLNVLHRPGVYRLPVKYWYTYIAEENGAEYRPAFNEMLNFQYHTLLEIKSLRSVKDFLRMGRDFHIFFNGSMRGQRALVKDPFAVFSAPWFAQQLNCKVVVTARHPGGFVGSLKRLGWNFDFGNFLNQPLFMRDHLEDDRAAMEATDKNDIVGQAALLWKIVYRFVHGTRSLFPEFHIVRHEDLSRDPIGGFQNLYQALGLDFTERVKGIIQNSSNSENPKKLAKHRTHSVNLDSRANLDNWRKILSHEEIQRVRNLTEGVWQQFYSETEW